MEHGNGEVIALLAGACFAAGLNVYATLAALGLLARADVLQLPQPLHMVESWTVIGVALVMFVIEFFADKIPAFDLIWNALQTFIRVPVAALLAYGGTEQMGAGTQAVATLSGGALALAAHSGKTAARAAVTPSPEPFSNSALSFGEDILAVGLVWFAAEHPYIATAIVAVLLLLIVLALRWVIRAMRRLFRGASRVANA